MNEQGNEQAWCWPWKLVCCISLLKTRPLTSWLSGEVLGRVFQAGGALGGKAQGKLGHGFLGELVEIYSQSCCRYLVHPNTISYFCCVLLCSVAVLLQGSLIFASSVDAGLIRAVVFWQKCWCPNSLVVDKGSFLVLFSHDLKPTPVFFASLCGRIFLYLFSVIITCIEPSLHRNSVKPQTA